MASRFIDTSIWNEDWFCELGNEYQNLWVYITCECDNAGIWKPNKIDFEIKSRTKVNLVAFLEKVNEAGKKERIIVTDSGRWFITGFIAFQWFNKKSSFDLVLKNKLHKHIYELLNKSGISIEKVRGLREVLVEVLPDLQGQGQGNINPIPVLDKPSENFKIEDCLKIALRDKRWVDANKTGEKELLEFNGVLERRGVYSKLPIEYKSHFANWKAGGKAELKEEPVKRMVV